MVSGYLFPQAPDRAVTLSTHFYLWLERELHLRFFCHPCLTGFEADRICPGILVYQLPPVNNGDGTPGFWYTVGESNSSYLRERRVS